MIRIHHRRGIDSTFAPRRRGPFASVGKGKSMFDTARAIAVALGDGWDAKNGYADDGRDAFLFRASGELIHLTRDGYRQSGRIEIMGTGEPELSDHWPHDRARQGRRRHQITVSTTKTPDQIARDISRRLLPEYLAAFDTAVAAKRVADEWETARQRLVNEIIDTLDGKATPPHCRGDVEFGDWHSNSEINGHVTVSGSDAKLEIRVPRPFVLDFVRHMATFTSDTSRT